MQLSMLLLLAPFGVLAAPALTGRAEDPQNTPTKTSGAPGAGGSPVPRTNPFRALAYNSKNPRIHLRELNEFGGYFYLNHPTTTSGGKCLGHTFPPPVTAFRLDPKDQFGGKLYMASQVLQQVYVAQDGKLKTLTEKEPKQGATDADTQFIYKPAEASNPWGTLEFNDTTTKELRQWWGCAQGDGSYRVEIGVSGDKNTGCEVFTVVTAAKESADAVACEYV